MPKIPKRKNNCKNAGKPNTKDKYENIKYGSTNYENKKLYLLSFAFYRSAY